MESQGFEELYIDCLRDLYSAEQQLATALPKLAEAATTEELKEAFRLHTEQTERQAERLQEIFQDLEDSAEGKECKAMRGLVEEAEEHLQELEEGPVLDAALIGAAQKVENYEIAGYGTARTYATLLGYEEHASILQQILDEESETDEKLTDIAESMVNEMALNSEEEETKSA